MLYNSVLFITVFLPIVMIGWFLLNRFNRIGLAKWFVIGMSFWFYGYFNLSYIFILLGSLLFNYSVYLCRNRAAGKIAKALTIFGVAGNLALLFYYKYMNFFVDNINAIFKTDIFIEKVSR